MIQGYIYDDLTGDTLPGAHIVAVDAGGSVIDGLGTSSDMDGYYELDGLLTGDRLQASFTGYTSQIQEVGSDQAIPFRLVPSTENLGAAEVVAFKSWWGKNKAWALPLIIVVIFIALAWISKNHLGR